MFPWLPKRNEPCDEARRDVEAKSSSCCWLGCEESGVPEFLGIEGPPTFLDPADDHMDDWFAPESWGLLESEGKFSRVGKLQLANIQKEGAEERGEKGLGKY